MNLAWFACHSLCYVKLLLKIVEKGQVWLKLFCGSIIILWIGLRIDHKNSQKLLWLTSYV